MKYSDASLEEIKGIITAEEDVAKALYKIRSYIGTHQLTVFAARLDRADNDYQLMKEYMSRGLKDPQLESIYNGLLRNLYRLNSDIQLSRMLKQNGSYMSAFHEAQSLNTDYESIRSRLEEFVQETTLLSLEPRPTRSDKQRQLNMAHQQYLNVLFNTILVSPQWSESTARFAKQMFCSPTIDVLDARLLLSAVTVATIQLFDLHKFLTLVYVFEHTLDQPLRQRALVGIVLSMLQAEGNIFTEMPEALNRLCRDDNNAHQLLELQIQFFYCINADADNEKIQRDIIPNLMKGNNLMMSRNGLVEKEEDPMQDILNPGAADQAMEELEKNFNQMLNMQKSGSDIFFGGFSQMKRFSFFLTLSNWFVPFYLEHPDLEHINRKLGHSKLMQLLLDNGPFCDSDKYSFALAMSSVIEQIPENMRDMLNSPEVFGPTLSPDERDKPAYIRRMYLQDFYRFYRLFTNKNDFHNPFARKADQNSVFFFPNPMLRDTPLKKYAVELGAFLYKHQFYDRLNLLLAAYTDNDNIEYCKLAALASYKNKNYAQADRAYDRALKLNPHDPQAIKGKAYTSFCLANYAQAVRYYKRLLESDGENNERVLLNLALSLINNNEIEEGMNHLFKLNYDHPENLTVQRSLAWGYLRQEKPQQAETIYARLLANQNRIPADYLNAGYCKWVLANVTDAISLFRQYEALRNDVDKTSTHLSLYNIFASDSQLLSQYRIGKIEQHIMTDLVQTNQ